MSVLDSSLQKCLPGTHKDWGNYFIFTSSFFRIMDRSEIQWYYLDPGTMYTVQRLPNNYVLYKWNNITWAKRKMVERWLREQEGLQKTKSHLPLVCGYHMSPLALCVPIHAGFGSDSCDQGSVLSTSNYVHGCFKSADRQSFLEPHLKSWISQNNLTFHSACMSSFLFSLWNAFI